MISISQSLSELQRDDEFKRRLAEHYAIAIRTTAEYAIELDPSHTATFADNIRRLESQAAFAATEQEYASIQASFRGELRNYRDFAAQHLARLKAEVAAASTALQTFSEEVMASGAELERGVKQNIRGLETAAQSSDITVIRSGIQAASAGLKRTYEELSRSNHLLVAQLRDEIRALHNEMKQVQRAANTDPASGAWVKAKVEERIERLVEDRQAFWVLLVSARIKNLGRNYSKPALAEAQRAVVKRLQGSVGDVYIGRWSEDLYAAIVEMMPDNVAGICEDVRFKLGRTYSVQEGGVAVPINMAIRTAAVEQYQHTAAAQFYSSFGQAISALTQEAGSSELLHPQEQPSASA